MRGDISLYDNVRDNLEHYYHMAGMLKDYDSSLAFLNHSTMPQSYSTFLVRNNFVTSLIQQVSVSKSTLEYCANADCSHSIVLLKLSMCFNGCHLGTSD